MRGGDRERETESVGAKVGMGPLKKGHLNPLSRIKMNKITGF
jgi:hypothetical protein